MVLGRLYILGASVRQRTGGSTTPPSPHCVCCDPVAMSTHVFEHWNGVATRELTLQRGHIGSQHTHSEGMVLGGVVEPPVLCLTLAP